MLEWSRHRTFHVVCNIPSRTTIALYQLFPATRGSNSKVSGLPTVRVPAYSLLKQEQLQLAQLAFVIKRKFASSDKYCYPSNSQKVMGTFGDQTFGPKNPGWFTSLSSQEKMEIRDPAPSRIPTVPSNGPFCGYPEGIQADRALTLERRWLCDRCDSQESSHMFKCLTGGTNWLGLFFLHVPRQRATSTTSILCKFRKWMFLQSCR